VVSRVGKSVTPAKMMTAPSTATAGVANAPTTSGADGVRGQLEVIDAGLDQKSTDGTPPMGGASSCCKGFYCGGRRGPSAEVDTHEPRTPPVLSLKP
jgi:hypothetical protein